MASGAYGFLLSFDLVLGRSCLEYVSLLPIVVLKHANKIGEKFCHIEVVVHSAPFFKIIEQESRVFFFDKFWFLTNVLFADFGCTVDLLG